MDIITELFGEGKELTSIQIGFRSFVMFIIALIFIRIAGKKTFGKNSAYDNIVVIMLGAILSRGVVGATPFFSVVLSGLIIVLMSRLVSWIAIYSITFGYLVKGRHRSLYKDGIINNKNLQRSLLSKSDLMEGLRIEGNTASLDDVEEVFLECSGEISIIKKKK